MSYQKIPLLANKPFRLDVPGRVLLIDSPGVGGSVDVALVVNGTPTTTMVGRKTGFKNVAPFDGVILSSPVDTTVTLFLSFEDVNLGVNSLEIANSVANPVNVLFGGTVAPVVGTIANTNAQAIPVQIQALAVLVDHAPAVINNGAAQLLINDATYKRLRVKNASVTARVALGGAAVTMANAAIILEPGDTWAEDDAAGAAWYATSDTAAADVRVMGLK